MRYLIYLYAALLPLFLHKVSSKRVHNRGQSRQGTIPLPHPFSSSRRNNNHGFDNQDPSSQYLPWSTTTTRRKDGRLRKPTELPRDNKPNIILILTDDQDIELGSMNFMPKTLRILGEGGAHFPNAYVTTPMCCPSRSSLLTGMYVHNHNVYTNNDNCSSPMWQQEHETRTFATYLNNAGYRTAFFGKYLNEYNGSYIPPGWREWAGLVRNSRFYNYTVNVNGNKIKHGDNYYADYYPDLIANDSITFLRQSKQYFVNKPVLMVLSLPSPHGPEDAAPQFQHLFHNVTTHRTPSWNFAPNPDKQWLLRHTGKMEPIHIKFTDVLHTKRLQTLQSVDDAVGKLFVELQNLGELDNTYIFYTSDHGYHLGQFGLVKGKSMPFEFDVRVPFYVRGPKIPRGIRIRDIVLNLDIAPSFLDIAQVDIPDQMDGKSILPLLNDAYSWVSSTGHTHGEVRRKKAWRHSFLIERGKVTKEYQHFLTPEVLRLTKEERLSSECQRPEFSSPCQIYQKWECVHDGSRWRIRKCRPGYLSSRNLKSNCVCPETSTSEESDSPLDSFLELQQRPETHSALLKNGKKKIKIDPEERRLQRRFLKEHVGKGFKPIFIGSRPKRSALHGPATDFDLEGIYQLYHFLDLTVGQKGSVWTTNYTNLQDDDFEETETYSNPNILPMDLHLSPIHVISRRSAHFKNRQENSTPGGCIILANSSISCAEDVYRDPRLWKQKKERLDNLIKHLRLKLDELKDIRRHLKKKRPLPQFAQDFDDNPLEEDIRPEEKHCKCESNTFSDFRHKHPEEWQQHRDQLRDERQWRKEEKLKKKERKLRRKAKFENMACNVEKMNCFTHDNDHWKTAPFWTYGPFCFCQNANNNTFWCLRTINDTHNFLYCEFVTGFITYYDLKVDPYQLRNAVYDLDYSLLEELRQQLNRLRSCKGARECTVRYKPDTHRASSHSSLKVDTPTPAHPFRHWRKHQENSRQAWPNRDHSFRKYF